MNAVTRFAVLALACGLTAALTALLFLQRDMIADADRGDTDIMAAIRAHPAELLAVVRAAADDERAEALRAEWKKQISGTPVLAPDPTRAVHGEEGPLVTVFTDFDCAWCRRAHALYKGLSWRVTRRYLASNAADRKAAACAVGLEAADPETGERFHSLLMEDAERSWKDPARTDAVLTDMMVRAGFPREKCAALLNDPRWTDVIARDAETARKLRIDATPAFVIDGRITVRGTVPARLMQEALTLASQHPAHASQGGK